MRPYLLLKRVLSLLVLLPILFTAGWDWPTYLHDPGRSAASEDTTLSTSNAGTLTRLWTFTTGGVIAASPTIVNDVVYVGSWDGYEYALDATTGAMKWRTYIGQTNVPGCNPPLAGVTSTAAVENGVVYVGGGDSNWYALDAATGTKLWSVPTGDNSPSGGHYNWASPVIYNGSAYIGIASFGDCPLVQGQVLRVDLSTHQIVARVNLVPDGTVGGGVWTSPTLDTATNTVYVTTGTQTTASQIYAQAMVALDGTTLAVKGFWTLPQSQTVADSDWGNTPILFSDAGSNALVAATNKNGNVYAFSRANVGAGPVWQTKVANGGSVPQNGDGSASSGAFGGGRLYMAGGNTTINGTAYPGSVRALDPATGTPIWEHGAAGVVIAAVAYDNGLVIDGAGATLEVLDASSGQVLFHYTTGGTLYGAPSVSNGRVVAGGTDGRIYAFGQPSSRPPGQDLTNLSDLFNNAGITDDGSLNSASFDDVGYTYSNQALQAAGLSAGQTVTYNGLTFRWPNVVPAGQDNVLAQGQLVTFSGAPSGTTLGFLGAATHGPTVGTATITYTDGITQTFQLGFSDWTLNANGSQPSYGNGIVASMLYRNPRQSIATYMFYTDVALQPGKTVSSVTLPSTVNQGKLHVFAVTVGTSTAPSATNTATATGTPTSTGTGQGLSALFNNAGTSDDSNPSTASFDNVGYSYSNQALQAAGLSAGQPVSYNGLTFQWPNVAPGGQNNVVAQGQVVTMAGAPSGTTLAFLGAATHGPTVGTATITYTDNSTQSFQLGFSDWTLNGGGSQPSYGNGIVASLPYRNPRQNVATYVFYTDVALQPGKTVSSVMLPSTVNQGNLHIFAVTVGLPGATATSTLTSTDTSTVTSTVTATGTPTSTDTSTATSGLPPSTTATDTPTVTSTSTVTATDTPTATGTPTITNTPIATSGLPTATTATNTPTVTSTSTDTASDTPSVTGTSTATNTASITSTPTATGTPTITATSTSTSAPLFTSTPTGTPTVTSTPTATRTPSPTNTPTGGTLFTTSFESGQPQPSWSNTVDAAGYPAGGLSNVGGICCGLSGPEANVRTDRAHTGGAALMYSGLDKSASRSYAYLRVFDLSSQHLTVKSGTTLSYWIFPQSRNTTSMPVSGSNSTCVAIDLIFSGNTNLRDSGAVDQNGHRLHPAYQCGHLTLDTWNHVTANIGAVVAGKTIVRLDVGYDQPANTGGYRGYLDDISIQ